MLFIIIGICTLHNSSHFVDSFSAFIRFDCSENKDVSNSLDSLTRILIESAFCSISLFAFLRLFSVVAREPFREINPLFFSMSLVRWCYIGIRFVEKSLQMYEMFLWRRRKMRWIFYVLGHRCEKPRKGGRRGVRLFPEKYGGIGGEWKESRGEGLWYLREVPAVFGKSAWGIWKKRQGKKIPAPG